MADLSHLESLLREAKGPDRDLNKLILETLGLPNECATIVLLGKPTPYQPHITGLVDDALALVKRVLPGFWVSCALCSLSGDCSLGPDYNGPERERLLKEWPEDLFHNGFHEDLRPGDGWHRTCYAILLCMVRALQAQAALKAKEAGNV